MVLTAIAPLQLSFAILGELAGGYDSTAADPRTGRYVDAPLARLAVDAQVTHETATVRQILRDRAEAWYEATGGRDPLDSDLFNLARYGLIWTPNEDTALHTDASYAIGAPTLFFSRAGRPDISFARRGLAFPHQMVADYMVRQDVTHNFDELNALQVEGAVTGRYPVTRQPRGQNMFTPYVGGRYTHNFDPDNNGHVGARVEYYDLELFRPVWAPQAYLGWGHNWTPTVTTLLEGGAILAQSNIDPTRWDPQPFARATVTARIDVARLMLGASYVRTFGVVSATLGTGPLDIATLAAYWNPIPTGLVVFGDAAFQHGVGYDPVTAAGMNATFFVAGVGARVQLGRWVRLFARYDFQYEVGDRPVAPGVPDFVRHVALAGVQVVWGTNEDLVASMLPLDQLRTLEEAAGLGPTPAQAPVRSFAPTVDEQTRRSRSRLPGDPPDDEIEREERARQRAFPGENGGAGPGGEDTPLPGDAEPGGAGAGPFRDPDAPEGDQPPRRNQEDRRQQDEQQQRGR